MRLGLQSSTLHIQWLWSSGLHQVNELFSNYVVIIDEVTTQTEFVDRCEYVMREFENQKPCIVYISWMKEYSREEMQVLIDKKHRITATSTYKE